MRVRRLFAFAAVAGFAAAACSDTPSPAAPRPTELRHASGATGADGPMAVHIEAYSTTLDSIGATTRLRAVAVIAGDTTVYGVPVTWRSSNTDVVRVAENGVATGRAVGTATVEARYNSPWGVLRDSVRLTVTKVPPPPEPEPDGPVPTRGTAELPRVILDVPVPARSGRVLTVAAGGDLQAAIDSARPGDEIALQAGATFVGNFSLREKAGEGWVTIRSSAAHLLPSPGTRVAPADAPYMARIASPNGMAAIRTRPRAHHYRLVGLEVTTLASVQRSNALVEFGRSDVQQATLAAVPRWLVLDRSWLHGHDGLHLKRCLALNSASSAVVDSRLERCHGRGQDTQAILGWNGPGPFKIVNNYLADAAEVIMFGGANARIPGLVPADIEIRRNHIQQTPVMRDGWQVKNLVELKTAQRVLIADNVIEHVWRDGQIGFAFNLKSSGDCSWCVTRHVTVRSNYVAHAAGGMQLNGMDEGSGKDEPIHHVSILGNVFEDIGSEPGANGRLLQVTGTGGSITDLVVERNTGGAPNVLLMMDKAPTRRMRVRYNAFSVGHYGVKGSGTGTGTASLARYAPGGSFTGNALVGADPDDYPAGNFAPASFRAVPAAAANGTPIGADRGAVAAMVRRVRAGR